MQSRKISIHRTILIYLVLVGVISVLSVGYLWISSERSKFVAEANTLRTTYLEEQQKTLKREVNRALAFVRYMRSQTEKRLKETVKDRVYEAHSIAANIYKQQQHSKSIEEIKEIIKDALRPIRFNNGRGYFFAFDMNGIETLFAARPDMEGKNMLKVRGGQGEFVVSEMLTIIRNKGEGFYSYSWSKPKEDGYFPKIAFVKHFKPIGWVIGTGEYFDDVEEDIRKECIKWTSNIQFGKDGYVFAGQYDGLSLSGPATGKNMHDVEDINGVKIVQELIKAAKSGGGFVHYVLPKFEGRKNAPKISYAVGVNEWQWYIGAGVYVDEIETEIAQKQLDLERRIKVNIRNVFLILFSLFAFMVLIVKLLSMRIQKNLKLFTNFFNRASSDAVKIEKDTLHFTEFVELAQSANKMIDERKRAEEALQTSHERFLTVLDSIDATIYVADMETHEVLFMNNHMIEAFGKDMTGEICWEVFRGESAPCPHCTNDQLIDDAGRPADVCVWQGENPITGKWYINYDRAIEWTDGRLERLQIATDITNLKKMEEDLHQARKMEAVGILAGGIAHEFNNVLGIIIGNAEMALIDVEKWHPLNQNLNEIKSASLRARDVVKQLLNFSRKVDTYRKPIDMRVIVKEALKLLKASIPSHIEIQDIIPTELDAVVADSTQIHQLLINLCNNASQAMSNEGGTLKIELNNVTLDYEKASKLMDLKPGAYVKLSVSDTGGGIPRKFLDKIFDPYFTTKDVGKGTGMGLAVVHGIVRTHDGAIRADSHLGKGTVFDVYFPSSNEEVSQETKRDAKVPTGKEKIIFVDDEISIVKLYSNMLERLGYSVISETDPLRVVEHFQSNPLEYDLVISDMTMPNLTGDRLAEELIEIRPDIPIIVCTGFSEKMSPERAQEIGIKEVLMKPIEIKDLGNLVRKLLDEVKSGK